MFKSILVVCVGNICRSPTGEALLISKLEGRGIEVSSAGLGALVGKPVDTTAAQVMAAAGCEVWQQVLGHIGVLTHPGHRGLGLGRFAAAVATEEAFTDGLIPQWRAAAESPGSLRLAISLGYLQAGHQTTVALA